MIDSAPQKSGLLGRIFDRAFGVAARSMNALGSLLILAVMILMCVDVLMRDLANRPINGVAELVAASIIVIVFLQLPNTVRQRRMVEADLFIVGFVERHPVAGHVLLASFAGLGAALMGVIFYATFPLFARAWRDDEFFGVQGMFTAPSWPIQFVVLLGAIFAALQYCAHGYGSLRTALRAFRRQS